MESCVEAEEVETGEGKQLAEPIHVQKVIHALRLNPLLDYIDDLLKKPLQISDVEDIGGDLNDEDRDSDDPEDEGVKITNGIATTKAERKSDQMRLYNFTRVKKSRRWLKNILLSDSSSEEDNVELVPDSQGKMDDSYLRSLLKMHKVQRQTQSDFYKNRHENSQYQYYSTGLLSNYDKYPDQQKLIVGSKKKIPKDQKKSKVKHKKLKKESGNQGGQKQGGGRQSKNKTLTPEQSLIKRRKIWIHICKKEISKAQKQKNNAKKEVLQSAKKLAQQCQRECRRAAIQSQKTMKEAVVRARRLSREMLTYWKRFEKVEKDIRKRAEKEALEQRKMDLEMVELRRQQRKLNFLITQTELYAHFMARKITGVDNQEEILGRLDEEKPKRQVELSGGIVHDNLQDGYDCDKVKKTALKNAEEAYNTHQSKIHVFDDEIKGSGLNPTISSDAERPQPSLFEGNLKGYQLKGMNWLANLYSQGINGILADEMGLGKTVQSIAFLAHLAETYGIWGPFLIVAPASTLHNWQQEIARFMPKFKCVPYWGNTQDRRILRKFWNSSNMHTQQASFHVVITSYQLIIQDVRYFQRINWHYMVLDEAQAIKSSSSVRWKILLGFNCRNRLLLTGTPIQNSMGELWALLHFIMPTMFDSHEEFSEWFAKDIENHAEKQSGIDEKHLSRLHMILNPFMLRRVKKDVENELSDKIEVLVYCPMTKRQKYLYQGIKNKISIEDLIQSASGAPSQAQSTTSSLMNLVMQFRKVCNHPELFERREIRSSFFIQPETYLIPKLIYQHGLIEHSLPSRNRLLYNLFNVFNPEHIHTSLTSTSDTDVNSEFSFSRFINLSPMEIHRLMFNGLLYRWLAVFLWLKTASNLHHKHIWSCEEQQEIQTLDRNSLLLTPLRTTYFTNTQNSCVLTDLVFTSNTSTIYTHIDHTYYCMRETTSHRKIRLKQVLQATTPQNITSPSKSPTKSKHHSPTKKHHSPEKAAPPVAEIDESLWIHEHKPRPPVTHRCQATYMPRLLNYTIPKISSKPRQYYSVDRTSQSMILKSQQCGHPDAKNTLLYGCPDNALVNRYRNWYIYSPVLGGLSTVNPYHGFSSVHVPDKETLVTDAGKLHVLDSLLGRLKCEGHRVLIYSQMTRMIDILEEYMWHRKHTYIRLDGSSKISDRRDMVADFQARSDIFVFLLSTRAGGLGINLTAADTVIFYDSDWNPTVDQQAMDRAHRLGQTKQVTVYRLVCKGTIEERIIQRAKEKSEIQRMVISGGTFRPDILKPKEVVSLLLDDDEMVNKVKFKQEDKKSRDEINREKDKRRKRDKYAELKKKQNSVEYNQTIVASASAAAASAAAAPAAAPAASPAVTVTPEESTSSSPRNTPMDLDSMFNVANDDSNDGLVIVDDAHQLFPPVSSQSVTTPPPVKRGRGRPKGSGVGGGRKRGRGSVRKALSAAEIAGAQAGLTAAYAAYGYNLKGSTPPTSRSLTRQSSTSSTGTSANQKPA
ncbi:chromatin-remodeling ATPase INO80-like [Tubulanus polymorphus]|uniref:chromatin-remodeling ATPase INO80-like n=1 Tax=Tubulanus polymorphus TaxID=672921 RepID=UPI003DA25F41